jgi:hypothetical protein
MIPGDGESLFASLGLSFFFPACLASPTFVPLHRAWKDVIVFGVVTTCVVVACGGWHCFETLPLQEKTHIYISYPPLETNKDVAVPYTAPLIPLAHSLVLHTIPSYTSPPSMIGTRD